jgi:uncharacterized protein YoxC
MENTNQNNAAQVNAAPVGASQNMDQDVLKQILVYQKKEARNSKILSIAAICVATALLISLAIVVPKVFRFIGQLEETVIEVDNLLVDVKSITKDVNGLADNVNSLVDNTNNMVTDNMGAITEIVQSLNEIDFDTLNKAITDLSDVVEPLGNMVRYFR